MTPAVNAASCALLLQTVSGTNRNEPIRERVNETKGQAIRATFSFSFNLR